MAFDLIFTAVMFSNVLLFGGAIVYMIGLYREKHQKTEVCHYKKKNLKAKAKH